MKYFAILDERHVWWQGAMAAATRFGYTAQRIRCGNELTHPGGLGFIRPHADPVVLRRNRRDFERMADALTMIQDADQMLVYENKSEQWRMWGSWMPPTWRFEGEEEARAFLPRAPYPLVSKADVGASSENVRILRNCPEATQHVHEVFTHGVTVNHCSGGPGTGNVRSLQKGYVLLQEFIPHEVTWRVNAIGDARAIFRRHNYADRPVAQTGNTEPVTEMSDEMDSLLAYSNLFFTFADTRWCALDILWDAAARDWRLLETSLAWPWPSPGRCDDAVFFGTKYLWRDMFGCMFDQVERGAWSVQGLRMGLA